jgi:pyruvate kinase
MVQTLFEAGVDVFRLNFSHGTLDDHRQRLDWIREIENDAGRPIAVLADLQGPKLRLGTFVDGAVALKEGQEFRLDLDPTPGDATRAPLPHPEIFAALVSGSQLLLDDGKVRLRVIHNGPDYASTVVVAGHKLADRKGVNVVDVMLPLSPLTAKDRKDLKAALAMGVDWVALSFVQRPQDIAEVRKLTGSRANVLAKLEKPTAIRYLTQIMEAADGVMVARGDLGVEMPPEDVPRLQKMIVHEARRAGKPVIVATQMLESMIASPTPTRAEASDVATAVYEGADAVMLSAETASGDYPLEAVQIMDRIIRRTQTDPSYFMALAAQQPFLQNTSADSITAAARQIVSTIGAAAIVTYTTSGSTTLRAARERPHVPIVALTPSKETARRLSLSFGVHAVPTADIDGLDEMADKATETIMRNGIANIGQRIVITAGIPFGTPGTTNVLRIAWIEEKISR